MNEPLVLLPSEMCDARVFEPQLTTLSRTRPVMVAPITQGERIEEIASGLLDGLPHKFALAGHGMGGVVAMELLRRAPDRLTRIALMSTHPLPESPQTAAAFEPMIVRVRAGRLDVVVQEYLRGEHLADGPLRAQVLAQVMEMARDLGPEVIIRQIRAFQRRRDQQATLRRCKIPAMVLCGAEDTLSLPKRHEFMAELIPYATLQVIAGAGHMPTLEAPEAVTAALEAWLAQPLVLR